MIDRRIYNGTQDSRVVSFIDVGYGCRGVVVSVNGTHPCAYIQVDHPELIGLEEGDKYSIESVDSHIDVHGGVTFIGSLEKYGLAGTWIGWDYAHLGDYVHKLGLYHGGGVTEDAGHAWTVEEIEEEVKNVITLQYWNC